MENFNKELERCESIKSLFLDHERIRLDRCKRRVVEEITKGMKEEDIHALLSELMHLTKAEVLDNLEKRVENLRHMTLR